MAASGSKRCRNSWFAATPPVTNKVAALQARRHQGFCDQVAHHGPLERGNQIQRFSVAMQQIVLIPGFSMPASALRRTSIAAFMLWVST